MSKFLFIVVLLSAPIIAQNDFEEWKKQQNQEYQKFKTEQDKQFADFLKKNWVKGDINAGKEKDVTPKPKTLPKPKVNEPVKEPS
jgi:hypothetical protein